MSPNQRGGDRIAGMGGKTSPCKTSVLNLGKTPRVPGLHVVDKQEDATKRLPAKRDAKHCLPTNRRIIDCGCPKREKASVQVTVPACQQGRRRG
jgi:hypothetical protein